MSLQTAYWSFIVIALAATMGTGLITMIVTRKFLRSFLLSLAVNAIVTIAASIWLIQTAAEPFRYTIGKLFFIAIAFVNTEVLVVFLLASLRKPPDKSPERSS
jgi:hypothetical protein